MMFIIQEREGIYTTVGGGEVFRRLAAKCLEEGEADTRGGEVKEHSTIL